MEFIKSINTKNILKYLIFSGIVYSLIKILPTNPLTNKEKTILLIISISALIGLDIIFNNSEDFSDSNILTTDYKTPVVDIINKRKNDSSKLLNLTTILKNSENSTKLLIEMIKEKLLTDIEIKILYQNNAISKEQINNLNNLGLFDLTLINEPHKEEYNLESIIKLLQPEEKTVKVIAEEIPEEKTVKVIPEEIPEEKTVKVIAEEIPKDIVEKNSNINEETILELEKKLKEKEIELLKKEESNKLEILKLEEQTKLKEQMALLKRKEEELKRKEMELVKKRKDYVLNEMKYNELPDEFFKPIGEGLEKWADDGSYSILNTDRWSVPMPRPPVCISSSRPCEPCPLATSGYPLNLKEWDSARKVSNININKDWVNNL